MQCGRDLGACIDNKMKQRVVCLPTTKRLMRFESQCVEVPVEINLPRPRIRLDYEPVRYLKAMPRYKCYFLQEAEIDFEQCFDMASSSANQISGQESDDMISSLENISQNEVSSLQASPNVPLLAADHLLDPNQLTANSSYECSPDEQSYTRLPNVYNASSITENGNSCGSNILNNKAQDVSSANAGEQAMKNNSENSDELQQLCHYIHYCLYIFHGLYSPDKVREFSKDRLEYRIRTLMLNFKFVDAFELCLRSVNNASCALKIFEYFSKDTGYVPLRRADLRFLIYYLLQHFMERNYDLAQCENFFLADLDYYLIELAYVLYFNNNNTELEQNLNEKFKNLIARSGSGSGGSIGESFDTNNQRQQHQQASPMPEADLHLATHKLQDTDVIFELLSVKFKTIICQRLLKFCNT